MEVSGQLHAPAALPPGRVTKIDRINQRILIPQTRIKITMLKASHNYLSMSSISTITQKRYITVYEFVAVSETDIKCRLKPENSCAEPLTQQAAIINVNPKYIVEFP
jgi:hypothetical protein